MPSTYEPIATSTVSGSTTSTFTFTSIPATYTDLVVIVNGNTDGPSSPRMFFNGENTGTNYSWAALVGRTGVVNTYEVNSNQLYIGGYQNYWPNSATERATAYIHIMNYANTSTYKSYVSRDADSYNVSSAIGETAIYGGQWRSTAAVNRIDIWTGYALYYFRAGTTATIYGIKAA
jgi:hypothetical protein